ncbi:DUF5004 domain-containing protein [Flavobacterium macacae]|uniref:Lipocalin-like domain-containing protein n=1 Tax=Flavobacterium macacae TaxID=2488993 RepID=A0A3P3WGR8_9FLAO|nr:hypothetical protein [Flavobacterium macacae]RRJ93657.1 hypothetical protein EG849_02130 [Flavobacterium macacae]
MKKIKFTLGAIIFAGMTLTSCSSDDNNDNGSNEVEIAGTYNLVEFNTEDPTDFNQDGTLNGNQTLETSCYSGSKIILNSDGSFKYQENRILVDVTNGTSACTTPSQYLGTWVNNGGAGTTAIITATYLDENDDTRTLTLTKEGNRITDFRLFAQYPDRNEAGGAIYSIGDVEIIYEK